MIRSLKCSLGFAVVMAMACVVLPSGAQTPQTDSAVREAVRRQARTLELNQKLDEARRAVDRKDYTAAAKLYESCNELCISIGSGVDAQTKDTVQGLSAVRVVLAEDAQSARNYAEADTQIKAAIRVDPQNEALKQMKAKNDQMIAAQKGRVPSPETVEFARDIQTNKVAAATLIQDGRLLWEMGRMAEAEAKLRAALELDPDNQGATYYLKIIKESRYQRAAQSRDLDARTALSEVEEAWERPKKGLQLPQPNPYARSNVVHTGYGRQRIYQKLDSIRVNEVKYEGMELGEVIKSLNEEAFKRDPAREGVNFLIMPSTVQPINQNGQYDQTTGQMNQNQMMMMQQQPVLGPDGTPMPIMPTTPTETEEEDLAVAVKIKLSPGMRNVTLRQALDAIVKTATKIPITYSVDDSAVIISVRQRETVPLYTRTFKVDPTAFMQGLQGIMNVSFGSYSGGGGGGYGGGGGGYGGGGGGYGGAGGYGGGR
jgi:tetratricopeptide (TPR) repeat protein